MLGKKSSPRSLARMRSDDHLRTRDRARLRADLWLRRVGVSHDHRGSRSILRALIDHLSDAAPGDGCWPSWSTLAALTGYGRTWLHECLAWLAGVGLIRREPRRGRGRSTRYLVHPLFWDARGWPLADFRAMAAAGDLPPWPASTDTKTPRNPTEPRDEKSSRDKHLQNRKGALEPPKKCSVSEHNHIDTGGAPGTGHVPSTASTDRPEAGGAGAPGRRPGAPLCPSSDGAAPTTAIAASKPSLLAAIAHPRPASEKPASARKTVSAGPRRGAAGGGAGGGSGEGPQGPATPPTAEQLAAADAAALLAARWALAWGLPALEVQAGERGAGGRLDGLAARGWPTAAAPGAVPWRAIFRWLAAGARREFFIRAAADAAHRAIFVDDLKSSDLEKIPSSWARIILETSPGNFQAIFRAPSALDAAGRKKAQRAFIAHFGAGDYRASSGEQIHRWPGSMNFKRDEPFETRLVEFIGDGEDLPAYLISAAEVAPAENIEAPAAEKEARPHIHAIRRIPVLQRSASTNTGDTTGSGLEFRWALVRLRRGIPRSQIIEEIANKALARGKRKNRLDAEQYAALTVRNAELLLRGA